MRRVEVPVWRICDKCSRATRETYKYIPSYMCHYEVGGVKRAVNITNVNELNHHLWLITHKLMPRR